MSRSFTPRFDILVTAVAAICLLAPMILGLGASVLASI